MRANVRTKKKKRKVKKIRRGKEGKRVLVLHRFLTEVSD